MVYLRTDDEGWTRHKLTEIGELKKRNIVIGSGARIGSDAYIGTRARIGNDAKIGSDAYIGNRTRIGNGATIGTRTKIGNGATIGNCAYIGTDARIGAGARLGTGARIGNRAKPVIVYIIGSSYPVSYWGEDRIDIGCQRHTIAAWREHGEEIAEHNDFTLEQVAEYHQYYDMIVAIHSGAKGVK